MVTTTETKPYSAITWSTKKTSSGFAWQIIGLVDGEWETLKSGIRKTRARAAGRARKICGILRRINNA